MAIRMCGPACTTERKNSGQGCGDPQVSWEGKVIRTGEMNGYDDSDFYALVWDAEKGEARSITYASTSSWTYHNKATVDATPEVLDEYFTWYRANSLAKALAWAEADSTDPQLRDEVRSLTTRGKNVGVVGRIMWKGQDSYGRGIKVGIKVDGESTLRYIPVEKVELITPRPVDVEAVTRAVDAQVLRWRDDLDRVYGRR